MPAQELDELADSLVFSGSSHRDFFGDQSDDFLKLFLC